MIHQSSEFQTDHLDYPAFVEGEVVDIKALLDPPLSLWGGADTIR